MSFTENLVNRLARWRGRPRTPGALLRQRLGIRDPQDVVVMDRSFPCWQRVDLLRALKSVPREQGMSWEVLPPAAGEMIGKMGMMIAQPDAFRLEGVRYSDERVGDRTHRLPVGFYGQVTSGSRTLILELALRDPAESCYAMEHHLYAASASGPDAHELFESLMAGLRDWMDRQSTFRGGCFKPQVDSDGDIVQLLPVPLDPTTSHAALLSPAMRDLLDRQLFDFIDHRETLESLHLGSRRGLLLVGAPGTGKTTTCRYIKSRLPDHTMFVIDRRNYGGIQQIYDLARRLEPSLVVLEDVDLIAESRGRSGSTLLLGDLMNELDGLKPTAGVITLLTTNVFEDLEVALVDRPGRVDQVLRFEAPASGMRRQILDRLLPQGPSDLDVGALVDRTDGLTPAGLSELVKLAVVHALRETGRPQVREADARHALRQTQEGPGQRGPKVVRLVRDA